MDRLIINCDLGEDEPLDFTEQLLGLIDAANIGCGFHAGNPTKTEATLRKAVRYKLRIGAHPGLPSEGGRGDALPTVREFSALLDEQIESFQRSAQAVGAQIDYIKLHGTLYHAVETESDLASAYLDCLESMLPGIAVFALAQGAFAERAAARGVQVYHEAFFDRAYHDKGQLVARSMPGAVLGAEVALKRFRAWKMSGALATASGESIRLSADTLCVHADSPDALEMIRSLRRIS